MKTLWFVLVLSVMLWMGVCRVLRAKRMKFLESLHPVKDRVTINRITLTVEFPWLSYKALEFTMFKAFAIPSISAFIYSYEPLPKSQEQAQAYAQDPLKRYKDTAMFGRQVLLNPLDSPGVARAIRRVRALHGRYNVANEDYLYFLSLFVLEPPRFAAMFGYRRWTEKETTALFTAWQDIGAGIGIREIPESVEELRRFSHEYEVRKMVYADSNRRAAEAALQMVVSRLPRALALLRQPARKVAYAFMERRQLKALGYSAEQQPAWFVWLLHCCIGFVCGTLVALLLPPRPLPLCWSTSTSTSTSTDDQILANDDSVVYGEFQDSG